MSTVLARKPPTSVPVEDSSIKRLRLSKGISVRELSRRLSVTPGAISQMERSEATGTIRIDTLRRAITALGERLVITTGGHADDSMKSSAPFSRREDRVAFELHRAVAQKLIDDPQAVLAVVPENIEKLRRRVLGDLGQQWLEQWQSASRGPVWELIHLMLGEDDNSMELRQNSPFLGVLSQDERLRAIERARS
jgi:transcriptional regulator with XRE-family HTH domain